MKTSVIHIFAPIFETLFHVDDGLIELRALPGKDRIFLRPGECASIQQFIDEHPAENIFFAVAARKDRSSGRLENCSRIRALFADLDFKVFSSAAEARMRLDEFPLRPSILINSGAGVHAYWILDDAVDLQRDSIEFRDILRRLARALNADLAAAEPARVLRVPGTFNLKYDPPVVVTVKDHSNRAYSLDDFEFLPPELQETPRAPHVSGNGGDGSRFIGDRHIIFERAGSYLAAIPPAIEGAGGDHHTYVTACKLVRDFGLTDNEALALLSSWNSRCEPPWSERDLRQKIENARRYGDNPIGWKLDEPIRGNGNGRSNHATVSDLASPDLDQLDSKKATVQASGLGDAVEDDEVRPSGYSDDALADQFSVRYADELRYVPSWGWLEWTGQRWKRVSDVLVMERARPVCRAIAQLCREDTTLKPAARDGLARSIASAKTVAAVERLARGDARHYSDVHLWDADLWAFNTPGGTVNLRTGELRPHRPEDRITKISNATPAGECPLWIKVLDRITGGNQKLQAYLKRLAGYGLVGDPREECLDFFYGPGGNGKGTVLATLQHVFGEYATTAGAETFVEAQGDKHPCDVAKLASARLVICNEIDEGQRWDEARIKNLTGRDVMTARFMRQDFFDFTPQFTLLIAGNHKPSLKTVDESIRRRFHLIPFEVVIPSGERDENLKSALRAEADGIMRWAVEGCREWQQQKLSPPEIVLAATAEYFASEDTFEMWLSECCIKGTHFEERTAFAYESFRRWKQDRGEAVPGQKTFTTRLTERGFTRDRDMHGWKMCGLRLNPEERTIIEAAMNEARSAEGKRERWNR